MANAVYSGKKFEADMERSCPDHVFIERVRDVLFMKGSGSAKDYIVYRYPNLFLFELKSHKGASLPIKEKYHKGGKRDGELDSYGVISRKQLEGLMEEKEFRGVHAGFIVNFRDKFSTFFIPIEKIYAFIKDPNRQSSSIPIRWFEENGIRIPQTKARTRWTYDYRFLDLITEGN